MVRKSEFNITGVLLVNHYHHFPTDIDKKIIYELPLNHVTQKYFINSFVYNFRGISWNSYGKVESYQQGRKNTF